MPSTQFFYHYDLSTTMSENEDFPLDLNYIQHEQLRDDKLSSVANNITSFQECTYSPINKFNCNNIL